MSRRVVLCKHCVQEKSMHTPGWWCKDFTPGPGSRSRKRGAADSAQAPAYVIATVRTMLAQTLRYVADVLEMDASVIAMAGRKGAPVAPAAPVAAPKPAPASRALDVAPAPRRRPASNGNGEGLALSQCERDILVAIVSRSPRATSRSQAAVLSGYSPRSGSFAGALAHLRAGKLIADDDEGMRPTPDGVKEAGPVERAPTGASAIVYWRNKLGECEGNILEVLARAYPNEVKRARLAEATNYSGRSGSFASALAKLRRLQLVKGFRATDALMGS